MAIIRRENKTGVSYQVKVRDRDGAWLPVKSFKTRTEAQTYERCLINEKTSQDAPFIRDSREVSVNDFWDLWSVVNRRQVSEGWKKSQDQMFADYIKPMIGSLKIAEIQPETISRILISMEQKKRSAQTIKHVYSLLRSMFQDTVDVYQMCKRNPVIAKMHRPKINDVKRNFLTPDQAYQLLEVSKNHYAGPAVWIQLFSALRPSEVQGLRWENTQLDRNQILIVEIYNKKTKRLQNNPKQGDFGKAPIPTVLKEYLISRDIPKDQTQFVCQGIKGGMLSYDTYYCALKALCKRAGVPQVSPHELRHSSTELWINQGASTEDIRRLLNHKSLSATKHYLHRTDDRLETLGLKLVINNAS